MDLVVEAMVVSLAQIVDEIECPRPAKAARRIQPWIEAQALSGLDFQQRAVGFQCLEFGLVLNARQVQTVNLRILNQE